MKHPKYEKTLVVLKPDALQRGLIGEIVGRFERVGLKAIAMKMFTPNKEFVEKHYTLDPSWKKSVGNKNIKGYLDKGLTPPTENALEAGEEILSRLTNYLASGPIIAMVWQGAHAVGITRKLVGSTEPLSSDVGTIRGDFVHDSYVLSANDKRAVRNLVHASGSIEEAEQEIPHWFSDAELADYVLVQEKVLYDAN